MANIGGSTTDAFDAGRFSLTNTGRGNDSPFSDAGLDGVSDRWAELTPKSVINTGLGQDDGAYQEMARVDGSYRPGELEKTEDMLTQGSDDDV